jgi:outer membrane protein assembly factor BamB
MMPKPLTDLCSLAPNRRGRATYRIRAAVPRWQPLVTTWLVLVCCAAGPVFAQAFRNRFGMTRGRFIEPPRAIAQQIESAKEAIDQEQYAEAVVVLGDLLAREAIAQQDADLAGQDFFLDAEASSGVVSNSLLREAEQLLGALPPAGQEIYELRYGAKARRQLEEATAVRDVSGLREVVRRYIHTAAGRRAAWLLASLEISEGRPVAAVGLLRRLATQPAAREELGDALLVRLAEAEHLAGRQPAALEHLRASLQGGWQGSLAGREVAPPETDRQGEWLDEQFGRLGPTVEVAEDTLGIPFGGPSGRGPGGGHLPLSVFRWPVETATSQKQLRVVETFQAARGEQLLPPSWQPIKAGDYLLMRTTERMFAIDFETGLRIAEYPWASGPETPRTEEPAWAMLEESSESNDLLIQRVWNDAPYGRLTSDGERVYLLDDLEQLEPVTFNRFRAGLRPADPTNNALVALELASECKIVWRRGTGAEEPDGQGLDGAFFLGPPLPVDGRLYQLAELAGDTYLFCLDPQTGRELWRQQLLANEGAAIESNPLRRVGGAIPAYSDGVLVCPTAGGALVAIDLASRSFLWGVYLPSKDSNDAALDPRNRRMPDPSGSLLNRWYSGTPVISEGRVLVTPVEMQALYCFDLLTGEQLWPSILRGDYQYLAGVRDGKFLLVSAREVQAFSLDSGDPLWDEPVQLEAPQRVTGTGVFGDGRYLLPVSENQIWEIDLADGQVLRQRQTERPTGNLLAVGDSLVSQSASGLALYYTETPLRRRVEKLLDEEQPPLWAMLRKGELLLQEGKRDEAIDWLTRARALEPDNEEVRVRLVDAMLGAIREGKTPDAATTELLDSLIELKPQRIELLRLKIASALDQQAYLTAAERLLELSGLVLDAGPQRSDGAAIMTNGAQVRAMVDVWIAARFEEAGDRAAGEVRGGIDERLTRHIETWRDRSPSTRRRLLWQFGSASVTDSIREALVSMEVEEGNWVEAERWMLEALGHAEAAGAAARADRWRVRLAELYQRSGFTADALATLQQLSGSAATSLDSGAVEMRELLQSQLEPHAWPRGVEVEASTGRVTRGRDERWLIDVVSRRGEQTDGWLPLSDKSGIVTLRNAYGAEYPIRFDSGPWKNDMVQATFDGGLMILLMPDEIIAVDLLSFRERPVDAVLWRRPWKEQVGGNATSRSVQNFFKHNSKAYRIRGQRGGESLASAMRLGPIVDRTFYLLQGDALLAIDVATNRELWRSEGHAGDGFVVADGDRVAVVSTAGGVEVLRAADGAPLETRPWEPDEMLFAAAGPHVLTRQTRPLAGDTEALERVVRLRAPIDGRLLHEIVVPNGERVNAEGACARIIDGRYMALMTVGGRLVVWDLLRGNAVADHQLDYQGELSNLEVVPLEDRLVVAAVSPRRDGTGTDAIGSFGDGSEHVEIAGPLYCLDLQSGELLWTRPLEGYWGVTLNQSPATPALMLSRSFRYFYDAERGKRALDLMAIDVRDGKTLARVEEMGVASNFNGLKTELEVQPEENLLDVTIEQFGFTFRFVALPEDQDDPEPVVLDDAAVEQLQREAAQRAEEQRAMPRINAPQLPGIPGRGPGNN